MLQSDQKWIMKYDSLPYLENKIIQILSIAYFQLNQTQLLTCLIALNIKTEDGRSFDAENKNAMFKLLRNGLDSLMSQGFLEGKNRSVLLVNRFFARIVVQRLITEKQFSAMAEIIQKTLELNEERLCSGKQSHIDQLKAVMRILFYQQKVDAATELYHKCIRHIGSGESLFNIWQEICCKPFDADLFRLLAPEIHTTYLLSPYITDVIQWQNKAPQAIYTEQLVESGSDRCESDLEAAVLEKWMLTGQHEQLDTWLEKHGANHLENSLCIQGWRSFSKNANAQSIDFYEKAIDLLNKITEKRRKVFFDNFMGIFYILALIKEGKSDTLIKAKQYIQVVLVSESQFQEIYHHLSDLLDYLTGNSRGADSILRHTLWDFRWEDSDDLTTPFFTLFAYFWVDKAEALKELKKIHKLYKISKDRGYSWFTHELEGLIQLLKIDQIDNDTSTSSCMATIIKRTMIWEHTLNALIGLLTKSPAKQSIAKQDEQDQRMVWFLDYKDHGTCHISPREQKKTSTGWTKGRPIALKRLNIEINKFPYLTAQDKKICGHVYAHQYKDGWYTNVEYIFDDDYMPDLIGHPLLFVDDGATRVELVEGKPEFIVSKQNKDELNLTLSPQPQRFYQEKYMVVKETPTRLKVITLDKRYQDIADILGKGVIVPRLAENKVRQIMETLAGEMTIHSDIEGGGEQWTETEADPRIHVQISPIGYGLKISLIVRPFGESGPSYSPGCSGKNVIAKIKGSQMKTTRDLEKEKQLAAALISACPTLQSVEDSLGEWQFPDIEKSLELLLELEALGDDIVVEWPAGKSFKVVKRISFNELKIDIRKQEDWFSMTGTVAIDEQLTLDMITFLEKSHNRFIEIGDGRFIELTLEFRKRLQQLNRYSVRHDKKVGFHPLAALALEGFINEITEVQSDNAWKDHISKLRKTTNEQLFIPTTLEADLRDYQLEGIQWMACLSGWGVGACLADDMGLGKTLQAIAMLLKHAPKGPSLVIAPTSVCANWISEAKRFSPTLNMISLGGYNSKKLLDGLGSFDVVVCSYGLMQQKNTIAMLTPIVWQMAILDEAQAIKNIATQRSRTAMQIQAAFKLILTGTPIENHLGELWNLFQFITPGLLSTMDWFTKTFIIPIEKYSDRQARNDLKRLIQPFILRRTKSQVLEELPSRTEIRIEVELSREEMAFYEALRRQALERISNDTETHPGKKHLKILAEITKLRQACCHSELIDKEISIPSSKLSVFSQILDELLENGHKALVFSQFVGHLAIIRKYLDSSQINYQYLDGSTPAAQRKIAIDAFQSGSGDVFLISLKAGGLGLNLTAADYVIHLDPWWNPAVEDQASDRAHRIGQKRPVTIYRMIARDTVEEKIVHMHSRKRDLADSLLQGSDLSAKMSAEDLLELIREGDVPIS